MVGLVAAVRVDRRQVPDGDGELGVDGEGAVVNGQLEPLVPDTAVFVMLVGRLGVDGQGLGGSEGLDGDIELRQRTEVTASVAQVWSLEEGGIG